MTPEKLQEAIGLLPSDLVAEADEKRNQLPKKKSQWKPIAAMAACFAAILACGLFLTQMGMGGSAKSAAPESALAAPEEPAAAAPQYELLDESTRSDAAAEENTDDLSPAENAAGSVTMDAASAPDFALGLLQSTHEPGRNTLVSPLSVFSALAMTANGAEGQTLAQMEDVLGMAAADMAPFFQDYLSQEELKLANGIWFAEDDRLVLKDSFLESSREAYLAELRQAPMNRDTCDAINAWVMEKTAGMIPSIVDEIPEDAMLYLVNALAFEASWPEPYQEHQVTDSIFTTGDGREQDVELMHSKEHLYLETDTATGFIKPYKDSRYGFAVLLPREGISLRDCLDSLTDEEFRSLIQNPADAVVYAAMPKFEAEFDTELSEVLQEMGMVDAFNPSTADFSLMGTCDDGNLCIGRVKHRTFLSVAEEGTRAGAATVVEILCGAAFNPDIKEVTLDRPFLYAVVDLENGFPIFLGALEDMAA